MKGKTKHVTLLIIEYDTVLPDVKVTQTTRNMYNPIFIRLYGVQTLQMYIPESPHLHIHAHIHYTK
jgi:hypothetical protein